MRKIIDILAILLPALIILMGIVRVFMKKTSGINGLTMFFAVILLLAGLIRYFFFPDGKSSHNDGPPPVALHVSKHSEAFNNSVSQLLDAYYGMTEGFVNWDTAAIGKSGNALKISLDSLNLDELKKDTTGIYESALDPLSNAKAEIESILRDPSLEEKRGSLNILSDNIRLLLSIVQYDRAIIYWEECPQAFGEDKPGNWLSKTVEVRNPYRGTKDRKFGDSKLDCGELRAKINFVPVDTTKKQ